MNKSLLSVYATPQPHLQSDQPSFALQPLASETCVKKRSRSDVNMNIDPEQKQTKSKKVKWNSPKMKLNDIGGIEQCIEVYI